MRWLAQLLVDFGLMRPRRERPGRQRQARPPMDDRPAGDGTLDGVPSTPRPRPERG
ncbi:hypothetical protein [Ancylobacter oerskovii]|uniref:Uncharacterized protein n=1 Tax=Ancylobacter oerskovii TaxID=459519 RepID=A0ABW4Z3K2_9HYPH|nr:hypothetical protein [Ancylobacter oerskovii]MBS7546036.1 hypothetical protein [Ancylobacter oerskovii]